MTMMPFRFDSFTTTIEGHVVGYPCTMIRVSQLGPVSDPFWQGIFR